MIRLVVVLIYQDEGTVCQLLQYKKYIECSKYFSCAKLKYKIHVIHSGHPKIKVNYLPCDKLA